MSDWKKHLARQAARQEQGVAALVARFRALTTSELRTKLNGKRPSPTPWERIALRRVLRERGEE